MLDVYMRSGSPDIPDDLAGFCSGSQCYKRPLDRARPETLTVKLECGARVLDLLASGICLTLIEIVGISHTWDALAVGALHSMGGVW